MVAAGSPDQDRSRGLPGSASPRRRVGIHAGALAFDAGRLRSTVGRLRAPETFPLAAPLWPGGVPRPPVKRTLGTDYDSEWARRYPARLGRVLVSELVARPALHALASPRVAGLDRIAHLDEPVIFAANHASHIDTPLLLSVIPEKWRHHLFVAGAADYFFDTRAKAITFAFLLNAVPIERQRVSRDSANRVAGLAGRRTGVWLSSPKAAGARTAGANRTGPGRPGWRCGPGARSFRCTSMAPARCWPRGRRASVPELPT